MFKQLKEKKTMCLTVLCSSAISLSVNTYINNFKFLMVLVDGRFVNEKFYILTQVSDFFIY